VAAGIQRVLTLLEQQSRLRLTVILILATLAATALAILPHPPRDWWRAGQEASTMTALSAILILLSAGFAHRVHKAHVATAPSPFQAWRWLSWGLIFLAVDEVFQVHEKLDQAINTLAGTGSAGDWLDDALMIGYGLVAVAFLMAVRAALWPYRWALLPLLSAGWFFTVMVALDWISGNKGLVASWVGPRSEIVMGSLGMEAITYVRTRAFFWEEFAKLVAGGYIVAALHGAARQAHGWQDRGLAGSGTSAGSSAGGNAGGA